MHSPYNSITSESIRFFPDPNLGIEYHASVDLRGVPHTRALDVFGHPYAMVMRAGELAIALNLLPRNQQSLQAGDNVLGVTPYPGSGGFNTWLPDTVTGDRLQEIFSGTTGYSTIENMSHIVVSTSELVSDEEKRRGKDEGILDDFGLAYVPITEPLPQLSNIQPSRDIYTVEGFINGEDDSFWFAQLPMRNHNPYISAIDTLAAIHLANNRAEMQLLKSFVGYFRAQAIMPILKNSIKPIGASYIKWFDAKNDTSFMPDAEPDFDALTGKFPDLTQALESELFTMQIEQLNRSRQ